MKKLLIAIIIISSLFSQSLTKGWYNDDFEVPDKLTTDDLEVLGGVPGVGKVLTDNGAGTGIAVWTTHSGANTALSNLASVAINTGLLLGASDGGALGSATKMWSDLFLASGGVINFNAGDLTLTHSANLLTLGGGDLQLGANNLGLTGSFGLTGSRILKGWFTDLECTNSITIGGTALSALYQPLDGALTNLSGLVYVSPSFLKMTANDTYAVRTLAEALSDLSGVASGAFSFNDQNVTNVGQIDLDIIDSDGASIQVGTGTNKITLTDNTSIAVVLGADAGDDFTVDGTTLVVEGDNNRVGIGTVAPNAKLEVAGTIRVSDAAGGAILNEAATSINPTLIPNIADDDTGIGKASSDVLVLVAGGVEAVRFTEVGGAISLLLGANEFSYSVTTLGTGLDNTIVDVNTHTVYTYDASVASKVFIIEAEFIGRRSNTTVANLYKIIGGFKNNGGTVTQIGATATILSVEESAVTDPVFTISGTDILLQVDGLGAYAQYWAYSYKISTY